MEASKTNHMPIKCATIYGNDMWISNYQFNALFCYDCANGCMKYVGRFENQDMKMNLHRQILKYKNKLFFVPLDGRGIDVYNVEKSCFEDTILADGKEEITNRIAIPINERKVLLLSQNIGESLYLLDLEEEKMRCIQEWKDQVEYAFPDAKKSIVSVGGICSGGNKVYLAIYGKGTILELNIEKKKISCLFNEKGYFFDYICCYEGALYVTEIGKTNVIQICEGKINQIINNDVKEAKLSYSGMICVNEGIILLPYYLEDIFWVNLKTKEISLSGIEFKKTKKQFPCFFSWQICEDSVVLYPGRACEIVKISKKDLKVYECVSDILKDISEEWILENRFRACSQQGSGIINEIEFSLRDYLKLL